MFKCHLCNESFSRKNYLKRHVNETHEAKEVKHYYCSKFNQHYDCSPKLPKTEEDGFIRIVSSHAFAGMIKSVRFYLKDENKNDNIFVISYLDKVSNFIENTLTIIKDEYGTNYKIATKLCVLFSKPESLIKHESYFTIKSISIINYDFINIIRDELISKINFYVARGSNWIVEKILFIELTIVKTDCYL